MTQQNKNAFPTSTFPRDHVVAVFDDYGQAEQAVQELQQAGYSADSTHLFRGQDFIHSFEDTEQQASGFSKFVHTAQASSDEGFAGSMYLDEAHRGHNILAVYEPKSDQLGRIQAILDKHGAHLAKYFGTWDVTDL